LRELGSTGGKTRPDYTVEEDGNTPDLIATTP
jgi:hypothetical protein